MRFTSEQSGLEVEEKPKPPTRRGLLLPGTVAACLLIVTGLIVLRPLLSRPDKSPDRPSSELDPPHDSSRGVSTVKVKGNGKLEPGFSFEGPATLFDSQEVDAGKDILAKDPPRGHLLVKAKFLLPTDPEKYAREYSGRDQRTQSDPDYFRDGDWFGTIEFHDSGARQSAMVRAFSKKGLLTIEIFNAPGSKSRVLRESEVAGCILDGFKVGG